jgi:hypothetical protein
MHVFPRRSPTVGHLVRRVLNGKKRAGSLSVTKTLRTRLCTPVRKSTPEVPCCWNMSTTNSEGFESSQLCTSSSTSFRLWSLTSRAPCTIQMSSGLKELDE